MLKQLFNYATDIVEILPVGTTFTVQDLFGSIVWTEVRKHGLQGRLGLMFNVAVTSIILSGIVKVHTPGTSATATLYERI